jgi:pimeloyl-ACP methyl ester carboxylesterase
MTRRYVIAFLVILAVLTPAVARAQDVRPIRPVILLPGILGSKLADGDKVIWGDVVTTVRRFADLELPVNPGSTRLTAPAILDGVQILGPFRTGVYKSLMLTLGELGLVENRNLFVFPYDWRLSVMDNAARLRAFVDGLRVKHGFTVDQKFNILAHSMGGMVARVFILSHGGDRDVERLVTMSTPHLGSLNAFHMLTQGLGGLENWVLGGEATVKRVVFSFPGLIELLAHYRTCCILGAPSDPQRRPIDMLDLSRWTHYGWVPPEVINAPGRREALERAFTGARAVKRLMETALPAGVEHCKIAGDLLETRGQVYLDPRDGKPLTWVPWGGDGTVVLQSSTGGVWLHAQAVSQVHATIFKDRLVGANLKLCLTEQVEKYAFQAIQKFVEVGGQLLPVGAVDVRMQRDHLELGTRGDVIVVLKDADGKSIRGVQVKGWLLDGASDDGLRVPIAFAAADGADATYKGSFPVPTTAGGYRVVVSIPGFGALEEFLVALPKEIPR